MPSAASRLMPTLRRVVLAGAGADRTDGQLLGAFVLDRDADAFAGLVRRHGPMVLGVCRRVVGDHAVADDAFQAVFIVLARRAAAVKPREQVGNWLYGVAYRTALKARAVLARRRSREKQVDVMPEPPVSHRTTADWADLQPVIDEELARLPEKLRVPVVLCDLEGRAQREVAKHLGIPPATLATRIATARRTLAARLTKRGVTLSGGALAGMLSANGTASAVPYALSQGVVRAAEAVLGGGAPLVSAHAVQLSEGVMRMMLLTKLKAVAVTALTVAVLSGGLGLGLVPAYALATGDEPAVAAKPAAKPSEPPTVPMDEFVEVKLKEASIELTADVDDATFLRRLSLDLRGILPTPIETFFFIADEDQDKRGKVVVWMSDDGEVKAHAAKKLGVEAKRIRQARLVDVGEGQPRRLVIVLDTDEKETPRALAITPDGKHLTVELVADAKGQTVHLTPLVVDVDARVNLNTTRDPQTLSLTVDKDAKWTDVHGTVLKLQGDVANVQSGEGLWARIGEGGKYITPWSDGSVRTGRTFTFSNVDDNASNTFWAETVFVADQGESDVEFLKRVIKDVRGGAPTALEEKYFAEDKDPRKREKLLDQLLKDPAVAKKVGEDWKKKMLGAHEVKEQTFRYRVVPKTGDSVPEGRKFVVPFVAPSDTKNDGRQFKYQVVPLDPNKPGKMEWKYQIQPRENQPYKLVPPTEQKPSTTQKENVFEWKVVPATNPKPQNPPETPKVKMVQVSPPAPASPATPKTPAVKVVPPTPATPPTKVVPAKPASGSLDRLIDLLIAAKKSDADILDFVTIDVLGRLPTETEKKLTLGLVSKAADRKAAWQEVAKALAATGAGKQRSDRGDLIDLDFDVIELKGTIEAPGDVLHLHVKPEAEVRPELAPRGNPEVKPVPPAKK
jgi:RNA polymerase sigma factor (sigma-70 family)